MSKTVYNKKIYEDKDVIVEFTPSYNELKSMVLEIIKNSDHPMNIHELKDKFGVYASDERIREVLRDLINEHKIKVMHIKARTYYVLANN